MIALSLRLKILLTMFLLVLGTTGATLYVTARKVKATYQKLFQEQFETQINYFSEKQEFRLGTIVEKCAIVAQSVRIRAALDEGAALEEEALKRLYEDADHELKSLRPGMTLKGGSPADRKRPGGKPTLPGRGALEAIRKNSPGVTAASQMAGSLTRNYFFLDAKGHVLKPPGPGPGPGLGSRVPRRRVEDKIAALGQSIDKLEFQQVGYLAPETDNDRVQLHEVIVTKISEPTADQALGALVLFSPLFDPDERILQEMSQILSGIWLENEIHSRFIAETNRALLARLVTQELLRSTQGTNTFEVQFNGEPHRVFYRLLNPDSPFPAAYQICLYSLKNALKTQRDLRLAILGFSALALAFGFYLSLVISHKLTVSVRELDTATAEVQKGNFQVKVPVRSRDDIGRLVHSFNEMVDGLALKEKYHNVLNMVADKDVAEQLMSGSVALGGELREVSILFCDIRGFTGLTQNMPPAEVIQLLNEHMTALTRVVYEHHGVVDKFVGDLIMAVFGAPKSYGHDAEHAVRCAWRMIEEREKLNQSSRHQIQVGIGIATGQVVAGCMGSTDRVDYTVLGERVNLASRLCGQARPGKVVIDQTTRERLGEAIVVEPLPPLTLKGFNETIQAYQLNEVRGALASV